MSTTAELIQALQLIEQQKALNPMASAAIYKHTTPTGTPSVPYYTGPGGLVGVSRLPEREVLSIRIQPQGLIARLPWGGTRKMNPLFPYLPGFTAETGSNPTTVCSDGKTAGNGKT